MSASSQERITKFSDLAGPYEAPSTTFSREPGCRVSVVWGFALVLLAAILAVVVGIIVYFAAPPRQIQCDVAAGTGSTSPQVLWKQCEDLAVKQTDKCLWSPGCAASCPTESTTAATTTPTPTKKPLPKDVRLPLDIIPDHYDLELIPNFYDPDPANFYFTGRVTITLNCTKPTSVIIMHINELEIQNQSLSLVAVGSGTAPAWTRWEEDKERQFFKLYLTQPLTKDRQYNLTIGFQGPLKKSLQGMYLSSYTRNNQPVYLVTTQMQPTDARRTFPCFDEPALKATFSVTLVRKNTMKTLSNMPIRRTERRPNEWDADIYRTTLKMSTYLLAFIVCDFEFRSQYTNRGTHFRVWARPEAMDQVDYALETGVQVLEYFEEYFNIQFPLPKQDMIAVPDFAAGAMENWGLIVYRESALLYDPQVSSTGNKQNVAVIVSHELAHQWFGNLVSPAWWDDLWLNEGFASYVEYLGVNHVHPDWQMMDQIALLDVQSVFRIDQLATSHPIYIPVSHPDEINEIFDRISYSKGASVIRMIQSVIGEDTFRQGLTRFLTRHTYGAANHTDLWRAWSEQALLNGQTVDIAGMMNTWLLQMGLPMVTVSRDSIHKDMASVTQQHFLADPTQTPSDKFPSPYDYKWVVPFTYTMSDSPNWTHPTMEWMHKNNIELIGLNPEAEWIIGNIGQYGYYRVNYNTENWLALIQQLKTNHTVIPTISRAQILDDLFQIGGAGHIEQVLFLQATEYLVNETEYLPWVSARSSLGYIVNMLQFTQHYGNLEAYMLDQVSAHYELLGWEEQAGDSHLDKYMRIAMLSMACFYGHSGCVEIARQKYSQWMQDPVNTHIEQNLRSLVYCNGIRSGGQTEWDFAFAQSQSTNVAAEQRRLYNALACTREPWLLSRYLHKAWTEIRESDALSVIGSIASSQIGRPLAWDFARQHWDEILQRYGKGFFSFTTFINTVTSSFNTEFHLQQVRDLQASSPDLGSGTRAFDQAIERITTNIQWMRQNEQLIAQWLETVVSK